MRQTRGLILVLLAGAALSSAQTSGAKLDIVTGTYPDEQTKIRQTLREMLDAAQRKDIDRVEAFHLYGPKFTKFDDGQPPTRYDSETARKKERTGLLTIPSVEFDMEDPKIDVFGDVAVLTGYLRYRIRAGEQEASGRTRSTLVYVKDRGQWKITHEHFSKLPAAPQQ